MTIIVISCAKRWRKPKHVCGQPKRSWFEPKRRPAQRLGTAQGSVFEIAIAQAGAYRRFETRDLAGAALLAELGARRARLARQETVTGLGQIAGLEICATVVRDGEELVLTPGFRNDRGELYQPADAETDFSLMDDPLTVIERFETALR